MDLPRRFGKYELLERIATGGMAELYLARAFGVEGFQKRLVIKRILPALAGHPHFVSLFVKEARISVALDHPNIVSVYDLGREEDQYFMVMEYLDGRDLTRTVRRLRADGGRVPLHLAAHVASRIARGLGYAHSRVDEQGKPCGILHRDVSPHNVMLTFGGGVKLLDFGIARLQGEAGDQVGEGRPGGGKFAYMSPEQALGQPLDGRSDLFSLGIVLYELLVNHRLFQHQDPEEKLRRLVEADVPDPRLENPDVPERLWGILQRTLARRPEDRYPGADALEEDLQAFMFDHGLRADDAALATALRTWFAEERGPDPAAAQMGALLRDLARGGGHRTPAPEHTPAPRAAPPPRPELPALAERKPVAVVAGEVLGLTQAGHDVAPDALLGWHAELRGVLERGARRFGGHVERFADDGFVVVFGVPLTREEDLDQACACSLWVGREIDRLKTGGLAVGVAVAVHVGEMVVTGGGGGAFTCVARGDTVKLARRLCAVAEPGQVLVSGPAALRCGRLWRLEPGPSVRAPGRTEVHASHTLLGPRRRQSLGRGRWIPRANEIAVLDGALADLAEGRGSVVHVCGEAGMGKTRLLEEMARIADRAGLPLFRGRAYPHRTDRPMTPFRELVASVVGVSSTAPGERVLQALEGLPSLRLDRGERETLAGLFQPEDVDRVEPARRDRVAGAVTRLVGGLAREGPLVLALADIQFTGPSEREVLTHLVRASADWPVLWLVTARDPLWGDDPLHGGAPVREVVLTPLAGDAQLRLARDVLGADSLSPELSALVVRSSGGNPLVLSEVLKGMTASGRVEVRHGMALLLQQEDGAQLPPTVDALIRARVDALEPRERLALQVAAVAGLRFEEAAVVRAVEDLTDQAEPREGGHPRCLGRLALRGLVDLSLEGGAVTFGSTLVWETVRGSLLGAQLRAIHAALADAIEAVHRGDLDEHLEPLATHCAGAGRLLDAARYGHRAGDRHREAAFLERSWRAYTRALTWLEGVGDEQARGRGEAVLQLKRGEVALMLGDLRQAEGCFELALDAAEERMYPELEARCLLGLGQLLQRRGEERRARAMLDQGLELAAERDDFELLVSLLVERSGVALAQVRLDEASRFARRALEAARSPASAAAAHRAAATVSVRAGALDEALEHLDRARALAGATGDRLLEGRVLDDEGLVHAAAGHHDRALSCFQRALEQRQDTGYREGMVTTLLHLGETWLRLGRLSRATAAFEQSREMAREAGLVRAAARNDVYLGYLGWVAGDPAGEARLARGRADAERTGDHETALLARWLQALVSGGEVTDALREEARARGVQWMPPELAR